MSRLLLGAFGDAGHAFPIIALGSELVGRGHQVTLQTWTRWQPHVEAAGMRFAPAQQYDHLAREGRPLKPFEVVVRAARDTVPLVEETSAEAVVADILTLAPALAGEIAGVPVATLIPHVDPRPSPGFPPYSIGARLPRTGVGARAWRTLDPLTARGYEQGRAELNGTRRRLGLPPTDWVHNGISRRLALVGTLPELEYPRAAGPAPGAHVVGPMQWEPPGEAAVPPPPEPAGTPVVLVAPSTAHDPGHSLLRAALEGLADEPVRVIATTNRRGHAGPDDLRVPGNAVLVEWLSYARTMPACDVVISHAGHGTVVRALTAGCALVCCPATGDMAENAARVDWAGLGRRVPRRFASPRGVRLAVRSVLADRALRERVERVATRAAAGPPGPARAATLLEELIAARAPAGSGGVEAERSL